MRKRLLSLAAVILSLHLAGCGGGDDVAPRGEDGQPTPEQQKEIDDMKARMKQVGKPTASARDKELQDMKSKMLRPPGGR